MLKLGSTIDQAEAATALLNTLSHHLAGKHASLSASSSAARRPSADSALGRQARPAATTVTYKTLLSSSLGVCRELLQAQHGGGTWCRRKRKDCSDCATACRSAFIPASCTSCSMHFALAHVHICFEFLSSSKLLAAECIHACMHAPMAPGACCRGSQQAAVKAARRAWTRRRQQATPQVCLLLRTLPAQL
jgi:hypothetical protein